MNNILIYKLEKNNFNCIRFILAISVIFSHCFFIYYAKEIDVEPGMIFSQNQLTIGSMAVDFFFIISGFLILKSLCNTKTTGQYLKKRILRIVPGFFVAFVISVIVIAPISTIYIDHQFIWRNMKEYFMAHGKKAFLLDIFTLRAPHTISCFGSSPAKNQINLSMWTIQYEFVCYLLMPILAFVGLLRRKWILIILFLVAYALFTIQNHNALFLPEDVSPNILIDISNFPRFFTYFFAGSCFYVYRNIIFRTKYLALLSFALVILSCIWIKCLDMVLPFAGTYLLFYIAYHPAINFHNFAKKGDYSYGVYLYGWPIQQLIINYLHSYINVYGLFLISVPLVCFASFFSWHCVEKVFLNMKGKPFMFKLKAA